MPITTEILPREPRAASDPDRSPGPSETIGGVGDRVEV